MALALSLQVRSDGHVAFIFMPGFPMPETCFSRTVFGVACPACGLTRSFVLLAHGRFHASWEMHRLGWLVALAVLAQLPYRMFAIYGRDPLPLGAKVPMVLGAVLILLLVANWFARLRW